jgi:hypothetical protein
MLINSVRVQIFAILSLSLQMTLQEHANLPLEVTCVFASINVAMATVRALLLGSD